MAKLLIDIHMTDAIINELNTTNPKTLKVDSAQYDSVFARHGISRTDYIWNIAVYTNTQEIDKIYAQVISELNLRKGSLQKELLSKNIDVDSLQNNPPERKKSNERFRNKFKDPRGKTDKQ